MTDPDMIREAITLQDRFLRMHRRQLPGLCYWVMISRHFNRDRTLALHYAAEELRFCKYQGNGGLANLKTFLSKFNTVMTNLTDAGGAADDSNFMLKQIFTAEFRKIPELKDSVHKMNRSALASKHHTFSWQWNSANKVLENMLDNL